MVDTGMSDADWWRKAVIYQIYPRSFRDANGDGIGDLKGIDTSIGYLRDLGVDAIWLNPFYPSPLADGGYDVSDYRNVDPRIGSLEDFDRLLNHCHQAGIKVIIDIVPNHCSDQHPWFRRALAEGPGSPYRDRFVFRQGKGKDHSQPPTNWVSNFGGSAWEPCGQGWFYLHLFAKEQPDFNWGNELVREDFLYTLRFWCDRGVDGFRVDVSHGLAKDLTDPLRDRTDPVSQVPQAVDGSDPIFDRNEVHEIYRSWRRLFDQYQPPKMAVAETWTPITNRVFDYARSDELGAVFDFSLVKCAWNRDQYMETIRRTCQGFGSVSSTPTWVLASHDVPRAASRLGLPPGADLEAWVSSGGTSPVIDQRAAARRARAAALILLALPGSAYVYQGEELGLPEDLEIRPEDVKDPSWERSGHRFKGRDGCRVPLPWTQDSRSAFGFNRTGRSWLPQPDWFRDYAVSYEQGRSDSSLELYRRALALRKEWVARLPLPELSFLDGQGKGSDEAMHLILSTGLHCLTNFEGDSIDLPDGARVLLRSDGSSPSQPLESAATVWFTPQ